MDAALGSHPIVQPVATCAEIREIFDSISYEKVGKSQIIYLILLVNLKMIFLSIYHSTSRDVV